MAYDHNPACGKGSRYAYSEVVVISSNILKIRIWNSSIVIPVMNVAINEQRTIHVDGPPRHSRNELNSSYSVRLKH